MSQKSTIVTDGSIVRPNYIAVARDSVSGSFEDLARRLQEKHPKIRIARGRWQRETRIAPTNSVQVIIIRHADSNAFAEFSGEWTPEPNCSEVKGYHQLRCGDVVVVDSVTSVNFIGDISYVSLTSREASIFPLHRGLRRAEFFPDTAGTATMGCATTTDAYRRLQIPHAAQDTPRMLRCHLVYMHGSRGSRFHWHTDQVELYVVQDRQAHGLLDTRPQSVWTYRSPDHLDDPHRTLLEPGDIVFLPAPVVHRGGGLEPGDQGGTFDMQGILDGGTLANVIALPDFESPENMVDGLISRKHPQSPFSYARAMEQPASDE